MNSKINLNQHNYRVRPSDRYHGPLGASLGIDLAPGQNAAQLRETLSFMFPHSYIRLHHMPPHSVCSLFNFKQVSRTDSRLATCNRDDDHMDQDGEITERGDNSFRQTLINVSLKPSSEPSSRAKVLRLQDQFEKSLVGHGAKPVGLCPIRRAIYDQCFDEIIRQVTVGCIEQGLLLFKLRNEIRMTISCYRRLYESAVGYHLGNYFETKLQQACDDAHRKTIDESDQANGLTGSHSDSGASNEMSLSRLEEYYKGELAKRDEIIRQQKAVMRALNEEPNKATP